MTIKQFFTLMIIATVLCWAMVSLVIFRIDPTTGATAILFFYASIFLALLGTFSLAGTIIRVLLRKSVIAKQVKTSFRQGVLFSILIVCVLVLQSKNFLAWWNIFLLIIALAAIECLSFTSRRDA